MSWQICCAVFRTGTWSSEKTASLWTRQTHWPSWLPISLPSPTSDSWESRALPEVWPQALPLTGTTNLHTSLTSQTHSVVFCFFLGGGGVGWGVAFSCHTTSTALHKFLLQPYLWRQSTLLHQDSSTMNKTARSHMHNSHIHIYSLPINIVRYVRLEPRRRCWVMGCDRS